MQGGAGGNLWEANLGPNQGNYRLRWVPGSGDEPGKYVIQKGQGSSAAEYKWVDVGAMYLPGNKMNGANRKELASWLNSEIGWIKTKPESQFNFEIDPDLDTEAEVVEGGNEDGSIDFVPDKSTPKKQTQSRFSFDKPSSGYISKNKSPRENLDIINN